MHAVQFENESLGKLISEHIKTSKTIKSQKFVIPDLDFPTCWTYISQLIFVN